MDRIGPRLEHYTCHAEHVLGILALFMRFRGLSHAWRVFDYEQVEYSKQEMEDILEAVSDGNKNYGGLQRKLTAFGILGTHVPHRRRCAVHVFVVAPVASLPEWAFAPHFANACWTSKGSYHND